MDVIYDSFVKVTFDPDGTPVVLVDYGDALWGPLEIDGGQVIDPQDFMRASGISAVPRGNERHTLAIELAGIDDSLADSFAGMLNACIALPRTQADVLLSLEDGRGWRIANCAIESWPSKAGKDRINSKGIRIIGGALTAEPEPEP